MKNLPKKKKPQQHHIYKQLHQLRYTCPECSIITAVNCRLYLPTPNCQFPPNAVIRLEQTHLACHHGDIPFATVHRWFSDILSSFNFEDGYTFINNFGLALHFQPQPKPLKGK